METLDANRLSILLLSLSLLVGIARLLGEIARRFHQPAILGEMLAGVACSRATCPWPSTSADSQTLFSPCSHPALILPNLPKNQGKCHPHFR